MPLIKRTGPACRATAVAALVALALLAACASSSRSTIEEAAQPARPNVVLIFVDDLGYGDLGSYGATTYATPSLDRLAREGVRFTDFYVSQPVCTASRASLLTGAYANRIGLQGALGPQSRIGIHVNETTLGELFRSQGYATGVFGKWHLGHHPQFLPMQHGFDEFYGIPYSNDMWPHHPESPDAWGDLPTLEGERVVGYNTDQTRFTTDLTDRTLDFIRRSVEEEQPFFVYLAHPMPHVPLHVSAERQGRSGAGLYGDVVAEIDWSTGEILALLKELGIDEQTLTIFVSDNGPWLSYGTHAGSAGPLREGKGTTFEGGVRVPALMHWPGVIPAGRTLEEPAMTIDVLPTLAGRIGAELPALEIDGEDLWPVIVGSNEPSRREPRTFYFYYGNNELQALRRGRYKLHLPHGYRTLHGGPGGDRGIPTQYDYGVEIGLALFDLEEDIGETRNLAADRPEVVAELLALAEEQRRRLGDRLTGHEGSERREPGHIDLSSESSEPRR